jgi:hypothetical protein
MILSVSQDGSISERASRSQEDWGQIYCKYDTRAAKRDGLTFMISLTTLDITCECDSFDIGLPLLFIVIKR